MQTLLRTPLYERHVALGARMVPFAGWEMPVQYEGVIPEHRAVREDCGVFDVSHMGRFEFEGPKVPAALQALLSNDIDQVAEGGAQYTLLTNDRGGIIDDLIVYRVESGRFVLVVNASNREADFEWIMAHAGAGTDLRDKSDEFALLAVQGPRSLERLGLDEGTPFTWEMGEVAGIEVMVNRTGYTGEKGVELMVMTEDAVALWDAVVRSRRRAVRPRRSRHPPARGLLPAPRQRHRARHGRHLGRARLGVRARHGVLGSRGTSPHQGRGAGAEARRVRHAGRRDPAPGDGDRRGRRGDLGLALADARPRDRDGLRARGAC